MDDRLVALVSGLRRRGAVRTDAVAAAMLAVDRADFVPPAHRDAAYDDVALPLKDDEAGTTISTISQPTIVAMMLEELDVRAGALVLEIGTASGYDAALLAHLVGPTGSVVTVELDDELADAARDRFGTVPTIRVVTGDGRVGHAPGAPYDRIIVTVGARRVEPAWKAQLREGGIAVVPVTAANGWGECRTLVKVDGRLEVRRTFMCGFVTMRE